VPNIFLLNTALKVEDITVSMQMLILYGHKHHFADMSVMINIRYDVDISVPKSGPVIPGGQSYSGMKLYLETR
jgi:hypothetical protein